MTNTLREFKWINAVYFILIVASMTWISFSQNTCDDIIRRTKDLFIYIVKKEMCQCRLSEYAHFIRMEKQNRKKKITFIFKHAHVHFKHEKWSLINLQAGKRRHLNFLHTAETSLLFRTFILTSSQLLDSNYGFNKLDLGKAVLRTLCSSQLYTSQEVEEAWTEVGDPSYRERESTGIDWYSSLQPPEKTISNYRPCLSVTIDALFLPSGSACT